MLNFRCEFLVHLLVSVCYMYLFFVVSNFHDFYCQLMSRINLIFHFQLVPHELVACMGDRKIKHVSIWFASLDQLDFKTSITCAQCKLLTKYLLVPKYFTCFTGVACAWCRCALTLIPILILTLTILQTPIIMQTLTLMLTTRPSP